jgi:hypothetical protein
MRGQRAVELIIPLRVNTLIMLDRFKESVLRFDEIKIRYGFCEKQA